MSALLDQDQLDAASRLAWDNGIKILQGVRFRETDAAHISALIRYMGPKGNTTWADMGCGFGEVARLITLERPDLKFVLVNNNVLQMSHAPRNFHRVQSDYHHVPELGNASLDGVMFNWSLCHSAKPWRALLEAARVTKPGGELFVYDFERVAPGGEELLETRLASYAWMMSSLCRFARHAGWRVIMHDNPDGSDEIFRQAYDNIAEYRLMFRHVLPVVWKARREA